MPARESSANALRRRRGVPAAPSVAVLRLLVLMLVGAVAALVGCDEASESRRALMSSCRSAGICDAPAPVAETIDVVIDASRGSSGDRDHALAAIDQALARAASRPGSLVRVWFMGARVADTHIVSEATSPTPTGSTRARTRDADRFRERARAAFVLALDAALAGRAPRTSPIAESIAKVAFASGAGRERHIVIVTDAREFSGLADHECGRIDQRAFARALRRRGILGAHTLDGIRISFAFVVGGAIPDRGCAVSMGREGAIREVWTSALTRAGAISVQFFTELPDFEARSAPTNIRR